MFAAKNSSNSMKVKDLVLEFCF